MRILIALAVSAFPALLAGCVVDTVEAAQPRLVLSVPQQPGGHEVHKMFAEEKARATIASLPAQF